MKKDKKEKLEDAFLFIAFVSIIIALAIFLIGCANKKENIQCLSGHLYKVVPNKSYELVELNGCRE